MKPLKNYLSLPLFLLFALRCPAQSGSGPTNPLPLYHIYAGNTHSHTSYTWSHGAQWGQDKSENGESEKKGLKVTPDGVSHPPAGRILKTDWQKLQGPPSAHYALAKANGYDFYVTTDHSQEETFIPPALRMLRGSRRSEMPPRPRTAALSRSLVMSIRKITDRTARATSM